MEIPFYTSFKEFKDNYETDLEKWLSIYPDGDEMDYLGYVYERYSDYAVIEINGKEVDEPYYKEKKIFVKIRRNIDHSEIYVKNIGKEKRYYFKNDGWYYRFSTKEIIDKLILNFNNSVKKDEYKTYIENKDYKNLKSMFEGFDMYERREIENFYYTNTYEYNIRDIKEIICFIQLEYFKDDNISVVFNEEKYNVFTRFIPKIYKFINNRKKEVKDEIKRKYTLSDEVTPTAEEQHTTGEDHEKTFTNPQKIKILDTLNIRGWLQDKDLTIFQIEILLSDLFGISTRSVRKAMSSDIHSDFAENYLKELEQIKAKR
ncbi:hypothetical protein [Riemerella anatipestifer]|uniref:hypothetical protein n=1 Tax=Riemerella anatipestifer TaxID=34085 RepID=UPI001C98EE46|nr:hypothetical protein [Riemerella anatipestifer]QZO84367.1 hypothetical protein K6T40_01035 [Riemerella anatipestifer]